MSAMVHLTVLCIRMYENQDCEKTAGGLCVLTLAWLRRYVIARQPHGVIHQQNESFKGFYSIFLLIWLRWIGI